jgi:hypothetical protein
MPPKRLQAAFAESETQNSPYPPLLYSEAMDLLLTGAWREKPDTYFYLHDGQENMFVIQPDGKVFEVNIRVKDKFGILGLVGQTKVLELNFGLMELEDIGQLLKLFYADQYPTLRSLHRGMKMQA